MIKDNGYPVYFIKHHPSYVFRSVVYSQAHSDMIGQQHLDHKTECWIV